MDIFYNADYLGVNVNISVNETVGEDAEIDPSIYIKVLSVFIIRVGLFVAEVFSIPSSNVQVLVLHNIIDLTVTSIGYGLIGFVFAFGEDFKSLIGVRGFLDGDSNHNDFINGWSILAVTSGLLTASIGDRVSFFAGLALNLVLSCFAYPFLFHWTLSPNGWMRSMHFAGIKVSYKDYCYSCLIHMAGGYVCFLGMIVLDKRMLRFKDLDSSSIPDIGPNIAIFGYLLSLLGFIGLSIPSRRYLQTHLLFNFYGVVVVNAIFAIAGTMMTSLLLNFACPFHDRSSKWSNLRFAQGGIAGMAVIAGGMDVYYPMVALATGLVNGLVFFMESHIMYKTKLEDYCNISAVHFFSGLLGTLLPPILGVREGFKVSAYNDFVHFLWQFVCDIAILLFLGVIIMPMLFVFDRCGVLRTVEEEANHRRAKSAMKLIPKLPLAKRIFDWEDKSRQAKEAKSSSRGNPYPSDKSDKVNVLFQKNADFAVPVKLPAASGDESGKKTDSDSKSFMNYMVETKTFSPFFGEIESDSVRETDSVREGENEGQRNAKAFEMRVMNGIRNISDSKIFKGLRDSIDGPRKKRPKTIDSRSGQSSMSNIWLPSTSDMNFTFETQV